MFDVWRNFIPRARGAGHEVIGIALFPEALGKFRGAKKYIKCLLIFGPKACIKVFILGVKKRFLFLRESFSGEGKFATYNGLGKKLGIEILRADNPNKKEIIDWVKERKIDVIILSVGYIIKRPLIEAARVAILNKHSSLLPANKGLLPVFWTLKEGNLPVGVTIHKINEKIDEGEILFQRVVNERLPTVFAYYKKIHDDLPAELIESLDILAGREKPQTIAGFRQSSYHSLPTRADYKDLLSKGYRLI